MKEVVVIGAGVAGIATAARLAKAGYRVTVLEKTDRPGGRASLIQRDGFTFDTGPSLFLMPPTFEATYADLGERMTDHLDLIRVDPTYRIHFHDGSTIDLTGDLCRMREQLEALEPGSTAALLKFLAQGHRRYYTSLERFVGRNFRSLGEYLSLRNLPLLFTLKPLSKHYGETARYFDDPRLRAAFSFQNMYLGLSPFDAPATYTLLQFTELAEGVWYPRQGMYSIVQSLTSIAEGFGARFIYDTPVQRIDTDGAKATGVTLDSGETVRADVVVANADLPYVYGTLLPQERGGPRLDRLKYTSATLMFYWGLRGERTPSLLHHNVFLSEDRYQDSFDRIFSDHTLPNSPSFYIHAPVRSVPTMAPEGCDALMVLVPTGHMVEGRKEDWPALQDKAREWVFHRLDEIGVPAVSSRLLFEETFVPPDYQRIWNLSKGAAFGLSHNVMQVGYLRPRNRHGRYGNLYFAGASTHPGTGVPIVLLSARLATERIVSEQPL